jgi:hypothetical protein
MRDTSQSCDAEQAARAALAATAAAEQLSALLVDGAIEIHVARPVDDAEGRAALSQYT